MGIDTSIYSNLLARPKSVAEYDAEAMQGQQNRLAIQMGQQKADEYTRSVTDANRLRGVVSGFGSDKGSNYNALVRNGHLSEAQAYAKQNADIGKIESDAAESKAKTGEIDLRSIALASQQHKDALGPISDPQGAAAWVAAAYNDPRLAPIASYGGTLEQAIERIPTDPKAFQQWKMESSLGADKLIEYTRANANTVATNATSVATNAATNARAAADSAASRAQSERHFNMSQENSKGQIVQTDNGPVLVDTRTGTGKAVSGPDGLALPGVTKPLNDSQSKALLFGTRMQESHKILDQLANEGTTTSVPGSRAFGVGGIISALSSDNRQMLDQAKRDFMTALLRRESGAAISSGEFDTADKQYFPQLGDGPKAIAQKARNRELAINGILAEVPAKQRASITPKPTAAPAAVGDIHAQADAILRGGK